MMTFNASIEQCTSALVEDFGESLRAVGFGDGELDDFEVRYIRDDIARRYSPPDRREIFEDVILEALTRDRHRDLLRRGELEYTIHMFERGIVVLYWIDDRKLLFVGVDRDPTLIPETVACIGRNT